MNDRNTTSSQNTDNRSRSVGVATPSIDLPKGGGALRGGDEKFAANPVTGSASFSVPLPISPSRNDFIPEIDLGYDSGSGNGIFGLGWSLSIPNISRKTEKGLPEYIDNWESDVFIMSGVEDLVPIVEKDRTDGDYNVRTYKPRIEGGFAKIEKWRNNSNKIIHWRTISADNITRIYGETANARIANPSDDKKIFKWLLEFSHDGKGNAISYDYKGEDLVNITNSFQEDNRGVNVNRYIKRVRYGNINHYDGVTRPIDYHFELVFDYGEHDKLNPTTNDDNDWNSREDSFSDYRAGFEIRTRRRCERVLMFHNFPNENIGALACLVRSLDFVYGCNDSEISQLLQAQTKGYLRSNDNYNIKSFPAMSFTYQAHEWNDTVHNVDSKSLSGLPAGLASSGAQFVDLYGEGLSGILTESGRGWYYKRNLGNGKFDYPTELPSRPLTGTASNILELEGNTEKYLVDYDNDAPGFYRFEDGKAWSPHKPFKQLPNIDFNSPHVRTLDLDGDGRADLLVDEGTSFVYYRNEGWDGFSLESKFHKGNDEDKKPYVMFADYEQTIFLADMSGDGLTDIVRVRNGNVCYWPNLGHGKFGAKVYMADSPYMDSRDIFNATRVKLADVDGSGAADLIYVGAFEVSVWLNKSGNGFTKEPRKFALRNDNTTQISVLDFLGNGTSCIVWSSPLQTHTNSPMKYIDLMNGKKPHLMIGYDNGMGKSVKLEYTPSTKFYLEDRENGNLWITKLPFPVHCLSKVVTYDKINGNKFASSYSYHHGYYDIDEREFRGFGRVDQIDCETFESYSGASNAEDESVYQPPVLTKTWYHLGARKWRNLFYDCESEYHSVFKTESKLKFNGFNSSWSIEEDREAIRAFKGMMLRQEVYALDGSERESLPYTTTQMSYNVKQLHAREKRHSVYIVTQGESLIYNYERELSDPRVAHSLVIGVDDYGRPKLSAEVVYARRGTSGIDIVDTEQRKNYIVVKETNYANDVSGDNVFRMGVECTVKTWELMYSNVANDLCDVVLLKNKFQSARIIPFEDDNTYTQPKKRLVEHVETLFYNDDLTAALFIGEMSSHGLPYESYTLSHTQSLLAHLYGERVNDDMLVEGGFVLREDNNWWGRSGRNVFDDNATANFYLPCGVENAFGEVTSIKYDDYKLLAKSITDPLNNVVCATNDYRTLSPQTLTDSNGNRTAVETDALGIVVKSAVMGKINTNDGDTLESPTTYMEYGFAEFDENGNITKPSWIKTFSRETHGDENTRWLEQLEFSDGMGNIALVKTKAEPRDNNVCWIGTGRTVLNNKGNPVKQYEPYFSDTDEWENELEIREIGVTPIMYYDPLSRLIKTDFPDGTFSKVEFTAWEQKDFDRNDTCEDCPHFNTPTITHLDTLGRAFYVVTNDGVNDNIVTRTVLDIEGNEKKIIDARGNAVMEYKYGIHGEKGYTKSMDAGERWMLLAVDGQPNYTWDSRGHKIHVEYDKLRRPIKQWLNDDTLVGKTVYGEDAPNAQETNLRGQVWKIFDQSGVIENVRFDFKGNLLESKRQLVQEYKSIVDWNGNVLLENETFTTITKYDALNRATEILTPHNENIIANKIMPAYDDGGLLKTVNVNLRGAAESTAFVTGISYNPKGQRERIRYGNGATTKYEYEEKTFRLRKLLTTRNNGADTLQDLNYTYDPVGNITKIFDNAQQTIYFNSQVVNPSQDFEYDALYRLTKATGREHVGSNADSGIEENGYPLMQSPMPNDGNALRNYVRQWEYDDVGNILQLIHQANNGNGSWTRNYNYDVNSNKLLSTAVGQTTVNYAHNVHGSLASMPHLQNMEWDFAERLSHVTRGTMEAYYNYDSSGQRVRKVVEKNGITETRLYLGGFEIFRKRVGNNLELERETLHVMGDTKRIALVKMSTVDNGVVINNPTSTQRYQLGNHLESASLELDENADIISYEEYYPYGDTSYQAGRSVSEVKQKRYRYIGKERDDENGLYYCEARYYASWLGRWTATDPAGLVDGVNLYAYCRGHPVVLVDPNGKQAREDVVSNNHLMETLTITGDPSEDVDDNGWESDRIDISFKFPECINSIEELKSYLANAGTFEYDGVDYFITFYGELRIEEINGIPTIVGDNIQARRSENVYEVDEPSAPNFVEKADADSTMVYGSKIDRSKIIADKSQTYEKIKTGAEFAATGMGAFLGTGEKAFKQASKEIAKRALKTNMNPYLTPESARNAQKSALSFFKAAKSSAKFFGRANIALAVGVGAIDALDNIRQEKYAYAALGVTITATAIWASFSLIALFSSLPAIFLISLGIGLAAMGLNYIGKMFLDTVLPKERCHD